MSKIPLPPLPDSFWGNPLIADFRARDLEVARAVLEAAAKFCDTTLRDCYASKGLSAQIEAILFAVCMDSAVGIRALEVGHD